MNTLFKQSNLLKRGFIVLGVGIVMASFLVFRTHLTRAAGGTYFGGMNVFALSCTCSGNTLMYIQDYASHGELALIYQPGESRLFNNNNEYGTYLLGSYNSGGSCEIESGEDCTEIDSDGTMSSNPGTGTS